MKDLMKEVKIQYSEIAAKMVNHNISLKRKTICPQHAFKYMYECLCEKCEYPFICSSVECLEMHFHQEKTNIIRFDSMQFENKCKKVQEISSKKTQLKKQARSVRVHRAHLQQRVLAQAFKQLKLIQSLWQSAMTELQDGALNSELNQKFQSIYNRQRSVQVRLQQLNYQLNIQEKLFLKRQLTSFLEKNLQKFQWKRTELVYFSQLLDQQMQSVLQGKSNLLFVLIGQASQNTVILGSFYPSKYPQVPQRVRSPGSFLFLHDGKEKDKFTKFQANDTCDYHFEVKQEQMICQGQSWGKKDGIVNVGNDKIQYVLPTDSYVICADEENKDLWSAVFQGQIILKQVRVYQIKPNK